jgi:hypothetical protein
MCFPFFAHYKPTFIAFLGVHDEEICTYVARRKYL